MQWRGQRQSDNVEDERSSTGGGMGFPGGPGRIRIPIGGVGGGGISGIIILIILYFGLRFLGIDPMAVLGDGTMSGPDTGGYSQQDAGPAGQQQAGDQTPDDMKAFVSTVLAETEDVWTGIFQANGQKYTDPTLVLFSGQIRSACGFASAASGPFYCPNDQKVYLDTSFFQQLDQQFGAPGEFAQAYVVAHEVGHHVQDLLGILPKFNQARQNMSEEEANQMSVRVELQADCFAGVWGKYTQQKGLLDKGDYESALNAAKQIGDDTIQKRMQGYVVPESFNHGTSQQRQTWFARGFTAGKIDACDTFNNPV